MCFVCFKKIKYVKPENILMTGWGIKNKFFHTQEVCYRTMIKKVKCDNTDRLTRQAWVEETVIEITSIYLMSSVNFLKTYSILTCKRQLKFCSLPLVTTCSIYLSVLAATWGLELDKNHVFSNFILCNELGQSDGIGNDTIDEQSRVKQFLPFLWTIQAFCDKYRNHSLMDNFSKERAIYGIYIYIYKFCKIKLENMLPNAVYQKYYATYKLHESSCFDDKNISKLCTDAKSIYSKQYMKQHMKAYDYLILMKFLSKAAIIETHRILMDKGVLDNRCKIVNGNIKVFFLNNEVSNYLYL